MKANRPRLVTAVVLGVLGCLLLSAGNVAVWAWRTSTNTDTWTHATNPLFDDDQFVAGVSAFLTDRILQEVDIQALIDKYLPGSLTVVGPAAENLARQELDDLIRSTLEKSSIKELLRLGNAHGHRLTYEVMSDKNAYVRIDGDTVVVDLDTVLQSVADQLDKVGLDPYPNGVPNGTAEFEVTKSATLGNAKRSIDALKVLRWALPLAGLLLLVGSAFVAPRRLRALVPLGLGVAASSLLLLVGQASGRDVMFSGVTDPIEKVAGTKLWDAAAAGLVRQTLVLVVAGCVLAAIGFLFARRQSMSTPASGAVPVPEAGPVPDVTWASGTHESWPLEPPPAPPSS